MMTAAEKPSRRAQATGCDGVEKAVFGCIVLHFVAFVTVDCAVSCLQHRGGRFGVKGAVTWDVTGFLFGSWVGCALPG
jgi:hypothetical protein